MGNPYFDNHNTDEQDLIEDLINESINIHNETFYYVPRTLSSTVDIDIFNEDRNSIFQHAYPFTGYLRNASSGLEGNGYFMQKFGGIVELSATITLSKREWQQNIASHGTTLLPNMPCTGDLIYWPYTDQLFEIVFVDDKNPFGQLGKFYTYRLTVELMQYSSQSIETGNPRIDIFESLKTFNTNPDQSLWGGITAVNVIEPGQGYQDTPQIIVDSLTGSGATFYVTMDNQSIKSVAVTDPGQGYHSTDKIYVIGNCTSKAVLQPTIETVIENAGDRWGANQSFIQKHHSNSPDVYNKDKPYGTIIQDDIDFRFTPDVDTNYACDIDDIVFQQNKEDF